jgi:hypothetical protein
VITHGMILSVVLILNYPDNGQTIEQFEHQFTGPTAIEYCNSALRRLKHLNTTDNIMVINVNCIGD